MSSGKYPFIPRMHSRLPDLRDILFEEVSKSEGQLTLPFGTVDPYCIMFAAEGTFYPVSSFYDESPSGYGYVLARLKSLDVDPTDRTFTDEEVEVSRVVSPEDLWEAAREYPDLTLRDFLELKFMEKQMNV